MGVNDLNTIIKKSTKETPRRYKRVIIDGSNLVFWKLESSVSQLKKRYPVNEWSSIDKDLLYQTKFIINNTVTEMQRFIKQCELKYSPNEIFIVMDPRKTPCYNVNPNMQFENNDIKSSPFVTAIFNPDEIENDITVAFNIKEEEQIKRKQQADKEKQIAKELERIQKLDVDEAYIDAISQIYRQSYYYCDVRKVLKLFTIVLLLFEREINGRKIYIIDSIDEADLVIKNIAKNNIPDNVVVNDVFISDSDKLVNINDLNNKPVDKEILVNEQVNNESFAVKQSQLIDITEQNDSDVVSDCFNSDNVIDESIINEQPMSINIPKYKNVTDYSLIISADTDYYILLSDTPNVHCRSMLDDSIYSPMKIWKSFLGECYSYDHVIRIAALFGNDYTTHDKICSAKTNADDIKCLFNIDKRHKFNSLANTQRKTISKVVVRFVETFRKEFNTNEPLPLSFIDTIIHEWDITYFRKYLLSTIIYKNWNEYNRCSVRVTKNIDFSIDRSLNHIVRNIHKDFNAIYVCDDINLMFQDWDQFTETVNDQIFIDWSEMRSAMDKVEIVTNNDEVIDQNVAYDASEYI